MVRAVLACYPARWRDRYGEEFAAMLADMAFTSPRRARARLITNAISGALDARLNPPGGSAMPDRIRSSIATAACAVVVFVIGGAGFQKMTEDRAFTAAAQQHAAVAVSFDVLRVAAILAGAAVLAGAVPLAWSVVRQAVAGRRADLIRPLAIPPAAVAAWVVITVSIARSQHSQVHSAANIASVAVIALLGLVAAGTCAWAAVTILRRADLPARLIRPQVGPMAALSLCMAVVTGADFSWGLAMRAGDGALFHSNNGLVATSLPPSWAAGVAVLAGATAVTATATWQAVRQLRAPAQ